MKNEKFCRMLGLAVRAGAVCFGEGAVRDSVRKKTAQMVIVAKDGSENTKKRFRDNCEFYSVPYFEYGDRYELGKIAGRGFAVVISVTNDGIATNLIKTLKD